MAGRTSRWFLSLQVGLCVVLIFVRGSEDAEEAYRNARSLVLECFLPPNIPGAAGTATAVDVPLRREKRDEEGSGEDETVFSELNEKKVEDADNSTQNAFTNLILQEKSGGDEGSGEVEDVSESSEMSSEESAVPIIAEEVETTNSAILTSTEMFFDKSEDFGEISTTESEETTTEPTVILTNITTESTKMQESITESSGSQETTTATHEETTTADFQTTTIVEEITTTKPQTTIILEDTTTEKTTTVIMETTSKLTTESVTQIDVISQTTKPPTTETPHPVMTTLPEETTTMESTPAIPVVVQPAKPAIESTETPETPPTVPPTPKFFLPPVKVDESVPVPTKPPTTPEPVVEETFVETKIGKKLEALPGNILQKENLSLAADPLLIANTRLMDSEENVQLSSSEPKRMGAYIVIGLILLSFSSLVGYITFRKRMNRKRQEFESHQESNDTEKALLSLSDYKDNSELEENHLKNNEITPIVVKSNSQINKFEKNTNFSSPKNLNTIANEKNIEKDNVLKSTAENLTQVIIEDSPKDVEEDKNVPNLEKLIVKTRIDQDSIPKKPIIINRSSAGYLPIPQDNSCQCPAHSNHGGTFGSLPSSGPKEYAFEVNNSRIRFGPGTTKEIGHDVKKMGRKKVCLVTDSLLAYSDSVKNTLDSLMLQRITCEIFDRVRIEPTDSSLLEAIKFAKKGKFDCFVAVGGGSVIDTCKAANLYSSDHEAEFLDYVNAPIGKGKRVTVQLKPMIAVPTTSGTGSETTGVCVFDYSRLHLKTGISSPALRPTLAIVDPLNTLTVPQRVAAYSGFDVLCHALESYTAIPYTDRPQPATPDDRPAYQGANPMSDVWAEYTLKLISKYFERAVYKPDDIEARTQMHLASTLAGMGFGNAGVHLCHGMSYAISGNVKNYQPNDYSKNHPIIPHGLSVVITAPAVFRFTASSNPERHLKAASFLGADIENKRKEDAGEILADTLRKYMKVMQIENGISELGYTKSDIQKLVEGTLPQKRINKLAPREQSKEDLWQLFEESMTVY